MADENQFQHLCGWLGADDRQKALAAQMPTFAAAAPHLMGAPSPTDPILLYKAWRDVLGKDPDYPAQKIGDCLVAGTMVLGETIKPIEQVQVGDKVWNGKGELTEVVSTRTLRTMKPLARIRTKGGLPITCTADHLVLAYRVPVVSGKRVTRPYYERCVHGGPYRAEVVSLYESMEPQWVAAGDLTEDDYLLSPAYCDTIAWPDGDPVAKLGASRAGVRMLGYFVGDGSASGGTAEFCVSVQGMSDELVATLSGLGYNPKVEGYGKETKAWRVRVHDSSLVECLRRHFYDADGSKVFPGWLIGCHEFLEGLCEADGCDVRSGEHILDSTSLSVIHGALATLRNLGFNPIVSEQSRSAGTFANAKPLYRITWAESRRKNVVWRDGKFVCHRVKDVEFIEGPATVYDIGVAADHHSFVANGFAVHNCVSFGHAHGNDLLQCIEIAGGAPIAFQETDTEFIYGESRKVSNNLGHQDGSYGAAAIKAMTTVGMVSRAMLGADGKYSGQRAKDWGLHGPPPDVEQQATPFKLGASAQVTTWDELVAAIGNKYPVTICSGQGFNLQRDADGFCRAQGRWGHCMFIAGVRFDRPGACIVQSWGPDTPSGPLALGQPTFSFWADRPVIERILGEGDSWALSKTPGFEKRDVPPAWKYHDAA